jgi:hypothetical protein
MKIHPTGITIINCSNYFEFLCISITITCKKQRIIKTRQIKNTTLYKTDGSVNKLVSVFAICSCIFTSAVNIITLNLKPGHAQLPATNFCIVTQKWLRSNLYRETAPVPSNQPSAP